MLAEREIWKKMTRELEAEIFDTAIELCEGVRDGGGDIENCIKELRKLKDAVNRM